MIGCPDRPATIAELLDDLDPTGTIRRGGHKKPEPAPVSEPARTPSQSPDLISKRVRAWIAAGPGAVSGQGGHARAFEVAQALVNGFELSPDTALGFLLSDFNPKCDPEWSLKELQHKVDEAVKKPCDKDRGWLLNADRALPYASPSPSPAAAPAAVGHPSEPSDRPARLGLPSIIQQPAQLRDVVNAAMEALVAKNDPPELFVHGESLVSLAPLAPNDHVKSLNKQRLRLWLSNCANWLNEVTTSKGEVINKADFPKVAVVESVLEHTAWPGLPRLSSVADVPVITKESGLLTQPGFDADSGVYLLPGGYSDVEVPTAPTSAEIEAAKTLIMDELIGDFPFADEASKANMLALFLLPFVRDLIDGPTPLHHIDAPQEGTGKSLLAGTWGWVAIGGELESFGEVSRDDWQKALLAKMVNAPRYIFLDNLSGTLDSGNLASALTSPVIGGRILGFTRTVSVPVRCVWLSSANNVSMSRELSRRTVYIRLDARQDAAWKGRKFKHKLPKWAAINRGKLVGACLTICQAWIAAGNPAGRSLLGGYESWCAVIDGILCNAGVTGLLGNADAFRRTAVDSQDELRNFIAAWWEEFGSKEVAVTELHELATREEMLGSLFERTKGKNVERSERSLLGRALSKERDKTFGDYRLVVTGTDRCGRSLYKLESGSPSRQTTFEEPELLL